MIRSVLLGVALASASVSVSVSAQEAPAATANRGYKVDATAIGTLLDDAEAKAIIDRHLPGFTSHPMIDQARGFTIKMVQSFAPDQITDAAIAAIQADFDHLAPKAQ